MPIKVLHVGVGPIGAGVVRQIVARKSMTIVGAVDIDPGKVGRDLGDVCEVGRKLGVKVTLVEEVQVEPTVFSTI